MTRLTRQVIEAWALVGGAILCGIVLVNGYSIIAGAVANRPFPGDFELTEMGVAIAAFCFLPYAQLTGANVSADIFTMRAGLHARAAMAAAGSLAALAFALLLTWRMSIGLGDYRQYAEMTGILAIPIWWAFIPALVSLVLLAVAAVMTLREAIAAFGRA